MVHGGLANLARLWTRRVAENRSRLRAWATIAFLLCLLLSACQPIQPVDAAQPIRGQVGTAAEEPAGMPETPANAEAAAEPTVPTDLPATEQPLPTATPINEDLIAAGMTVYRAHYCGICHVLEEAGTTGRFGPSHENIGAVAASRIEDPRYGGPAETAEEYLYESLVKPQIYLVEGYVGSSHPMPPYIHLPEEDLRALVALLMSQQ